MPEAVFPLPVKEAARETPKTIVFNDAIAFFLVPVEELGRQVHREQRRGSKNKCVFYDSFCFAWSGGVLGGLNNGSGSAPDRRLGAC